MTGRIEVLSTNEAAGSIRADGGVTVLFRLSDVAVRDARELAVGQLVTFDVERGNPPRAFNICTQTQRLTSKETDKRQEALRYMGFEQAGNIRAYKFARLSPGGEADQAIVSADLSLFQRHRIGIQEGPTICLQLVMAELDGFNATRQSPFRRSLRDRDMLHHLAGQAARKKKRFGRRGRVATPRPGNHSSRKIGPRTAS